MVNQQGESLGFGLWDTVGFEPRHFSPSRQVGMLLRRNLVTGAAMAFRASLRDVLLPIPAAWNHDYWIALLGSVFSFGVPIQERLFLYRRHLDQQIGCGKVTFAQKIQASLAAEPDYCAKTRRIAELRERVSAKCGQINCPPTHLRLLREKELHLARRALIRSQHGRARIATLLSEALTGRYQRFSLSWGSMMSDLLQRPRSVRSKEDLCLPPANS
jgi:hypothetical protein